jgi:DNA modification methylase
MNHWRSECGRVDLYLGDCLDILPPLCAKAAPRIMVTDPPYSSGGFQETGKSAGGIGTRAGDAIESDTMSSEGYVHMIRRIVRASNSHAVYIFTDWRMWGFTREAAELGGHRVRSMIVWAKPSGGMGARWTPQHELILWAARVRSASGKGSSGNVLSFGRSGNTQHPTEKPLELMTKIIATAEPGIVIDPFMGSGTTGVAAIRQDRKFIGIELDPVHFATAVERIRTELDAQLFTPKPAQSGLFPTPDD